MTDKLARETGKPAKYQTSPDHSFTGWPKGIPYIIGNEACERFSFYGMKAILYVYLTMLYTQLGMADKLASDTATAHFHIFVAATYAFPLIGAVLAEKLLGKYNTIFYLSLVYCLGHAALAIFEHNVTGIYVGLALIAIGAGGIKPCVSANVGDQFGRGNWDKLSKVFMIFYFSINFGSFFSTLLIPWMKNEFGYSVAFAVPGVLMFIATFFFWLGRHRFVHVPAKPGGRLGRYDALAGTLLALALLVPLIGWEFVTWPYFMSGSLAFLLLGLLVFNARQKITPDDGFIAVVFHSIAALFKGSNKSTGTGSHDPGQYGGHWFFGSAAHRFGLSAVESPAAVFRIISIFIMVSVFWALFDQHASTWIAQAKLMDLQVAGLTLSPEMIPSLNPIIVMVLLPFANWGLYPLMGMIGFEATPLRRMSLGMVLAAVSFVPAALIQDRLEAGMQLHISWQVIQYVLLTLAEVLVSVTGLEFAYSQAPRAAKSVIMSFWLLTVAFGSVLTAAIFSQLPEMSLGGKFWLFAALMAVAAVLFTVRAMFYTYREYPQE